MSDVGVQIVEEMRARHPDAHATEVTGDRNVGFVERKSKLLGGIGFLDDLREHDAVFDTIDDRADGVERRTERHHAFQAEHAGAWPYPHNAAPRRRTPAR